MEEDRKYKHLHNVIISLLVVFTLIICALIVKSVFVKEISNDIYINVDGIDVHDSEEKTIEDVMVPPKSFDFAIPIFRYNYMVDDLGNSVDTKNYVSSLKLEEQFKYILYNGYETVYITELDKLYKYTKPVALTFDYCSNYFYNNVFPLLKKYNLKASVYIVTNYINDENNLTVEQINKMKDSGIIDIQSNTLTYARLSDLTDEEMKKEIIDSKNTLKELFNIESIVISYPYGNYNNSVINIVKENYNAALDIDGKVYYSGINDKYEIPRIYVDKNMTISVYSNYLNQSKVNVEW